MSKVVCEVCGTAFPETAEQCPICGCVRSGEPAVLEENVSAAEGTGEKSYTHVKGGRFSKANVKKRNSTAPVYPVGSTAEEIPSEPDEGGEPDAVEESEVNNESAPSADKKPKEKSALDTWLTVAIVVLLLSVIAIVIYIAMNFFNMELPQFIKPAETTAPTTTAATDPVTEPTTEPTTAPVTEPQDVACEALRIDNNVITLDKIGAASLLNIEVVPSDCTDEITFSSADESVATVTETGKVVAVGNGSTVVTAVCGLVELECVVNVAVDEPVTMPTTEPVTEPTTAPATEPTEPPTTAPVGIELNRTDFSLMFEGDSWVLYDGPIPNSEIKWSSRDERVVTVNNGKVVAVGPGYTWVYAEYNGVKVECIVHCNFKEETTEPSTEPTTAPTEPSAPSEPESGGSAESNTYSISHTDVTIKVGETFSLELRDSAGKLISIAWRASDTSVCSVSGNSITGLAVGDTKVYAPYEGKEYSCIVRVKKG